MDISDKHLVFKRIEKMLEEANFNIASNDFNRPWGGFFVIDEAQAKDFVRYFMPDLDMATVVGDRKVSPKILVVAPQKRLSWQYHDRRSEVWKILEGPVGIVQSPDDEERPVHAFLEGESITLSTGERHRLIGLENYGVVAEIWQHTDPFNPSNEEDIIRLKDDFGR
jgi:mannose-6-phosphate isomerase-like protein (cupin superfamily)